MPDEREGDKAVVQQVGEGMIVSVGVGSDVEVIVSVIVAVSAGASLGVLPMTRVTAKVRPAAIKLKIASSAMASGIDNVI